MSRMVHEFSSPVEDEHEKRYTARVRGDEDHAGQWQGWLEFVPHDGDILLGADRETSQSSYEHLEYWATGLSPHYLRMALGRARPVQKGPPLMAEPAPPPDDFPAAEAGRILEVETLDPALPRALMKATNLPVGRVRRLKGGAILVYEGADAGEGEPTRLSFVVHARDLSEVVTAANWIWTHVRDTNARLRVGGRAVAPESDALVAALAGKG